MAGGRPSEYSVEVAQRICAQISDGMSLRRICQADDMPERETVRRWLLADSAFCGQYARAREEQADHYADEIVDIADNATDAAVARLQVDARKWVASKLKARVYGERTAHEHTGADGGPIRIGVTVEYVEAGQGADTGRVSVPPSEEG